MARTKPYATADLAELGSREADIAVHMPPPDHQELLINLYFVYVHPSLPVIDKAAFMSAYSACNKGR